MPLIDMPLEELMKYRPKLTKKQDFDAFWRETRKECDSYPFDYEMKPVNYPVQEVKVYDVTYTGFKGARIRGWYILPSDIKYEKLPVLIRYQGYSMSRGYIQEFLKWALQGYAVFSVDCRGHGGQTPDPAIYSSGSAKGWMTLGILNKDEYHYRNVYMDCVRALDFVCSREEVDSDKIGVFGGSQGGGLSIAVAGLDDRPAICMPDYPYLCHFKRAVTMSIDPPYQEFVDYFRRFDAAHKSEEKVYETLSYFDGMNLAANIKCPVLMSIGLQDKTCVPSTVFATFNHISSEKEMKIYPDYGHEELLFHEEERIAFAYRYLKG